MARWRSYGVLHAEHDCKGWSHVKGPPRVVVIGAGFGGLAAARRLENQAAEVTLVDQNNFHTFQPLLYQVATSGLGAADVAYPVRGAFHGAGNVDFRRGKVIGVDWDERQLLFDGDPPLAFDDLIVAAGSNPNFFGVPGAETHGLPLYSLEDAARLRNHVLDCYERAHVRPELVDDGALRIVIVGGGPTGVEVAGAMADLVEHVLAKDFHEIAPREAIVLVQAADVLLPPFSDKAHRYARSELERRGVEVRLGDEVVKIESTRVHLDSGDLIKAHTLIWAAGIQANPLAGALGLPQGRGGRIPVGPDLCVADHRGVYVIGDVAQISDGSDGYLPQLAQVAIQSGHHAADEILRRHAGEPTKPFRYHDKGIMATIGRRAAVAELPHGPKLTGAIAWVAWAGLHLLYLAGGRNRLSVITNWAWQFVTTDRGPRIIFRTSRDRNPSSGHPSEREDPVDAPA